ncbi:hypothetical protein LIER_21587 [Lithospermum erythrorhizon]|uniref:Uncharacterized protein n=1 Tax=Lithospermum erythrorhizon TaxID=34254 RepID=A0AAV3QRZ6_LITER
MVVWLLPKLPEIGHGLGRERLSNSCSSQTQQTPTPLRASAGIRDIANLPSFCQTDFVGSRSHPCKHRPAIERKRLPMSEDHT